MIDVSQFANEIQSGLAQQAPPEPGSIADLENRARFQPIPQPIQGSVEDLENQAQPRFNTAQTFQPQFQQPIQQPQFQPQQQPGQPVQYSPGNPFSAIAQDYAQRMQAYQSTPPVRGFLNRFLTGLSDSANIRLGRPTDVQQRQQDLQNFEQISQHANQWEQNQSEIAYRKALMGQMQETSDWNAQVRPLELQQRQQQVQAGAYALQQEQNAVHPALNADDLKSLGLSPNLASQFAGKPLSSADMQALMQMGGLSASKPFDYGQDGTGPNKGIWLVNRNYEPIKQLSPVSETSRSTTLAKQQLAMMGQMAKTGYAYDPNTQQTVLTSAGEARQNNYQAFRPVTEANIRNDTHDTKILNDVAVKSNNVMKASLALDQDQEQRNIIAWAIDAASKDQQFRAGAFGTQIPTQWLNNFMNSANMTRASQQTKDYIISVLSLREASMGMQRLLTGTARSNESQIQALQATLPGFENNSGLALQKMQNFTQNLDMLRQGLPKLPGITSVPIMNPSTQPIEPGQSINEPLPSGFQPHAPDSSTSTAYTSPISYQPDHPIVQQGSRMFGTQPGRAMQRMRRIGLLRST